MTSPSAQRAGLIAALSVAVFAAACTQEQQNKLSREIQNWIGTDDGKPRAYRYGYGTLDENLNMQVDPGEKKVYFEISDYTNAVFFENPR